MITAIISILTFFIGLGIGLLVGYLTINDILDEIGGKHDTKGKNLG